MGRISIKPNSIVRKFKSRFDYTLLGQDITTNNFVNCCHILPNHSASSWITSGRIEFDPITGRSRGSRGLFPFKKQFKRILSDFQLSPTILKNPLSIADFESRGKEIKTVPRSDCFSSVPALTTQAVGGLRSEVGHHQQAI